MANHNDLKTDIRQYIYSNQNEEITGNILRDVLLEMVDTLGDGWTYKGVATTTANPGTPDSNVFYIATAPGTYTNFKNSSNVALEVADGEVAILKYNGSWAKDVTGAATSAQVTQLGQEVDENDLVNILGYYDIEFVQANISTDSGITVAGTTRVAMICGAIPTPALLVAPSGYRINAVYYYNSYFSDKEKSFISMSTANARTFAPDTTKPYLRFTIRRDDNGTITADEVRNAFPTPLFKTRLQDGLLALRNLLLDGSFEQGTIGLSDGANADATTRIRLRYPIKLNETIAVPDGYAISYAFEYGNDGSFTKYHYFNAEGVGTQRVPAFGSKNIRLVIRRIDNVDFSVEDLLADLKGEPIVSTASDISVKYNISGGYYNKGLLKLPSSYSPTGKKTPIIIFVHGSADYGSINSTTMSSSYNTYLNYLRDCGYAVFDCYGWGSKYNQTTAGYANTWGLPINDNCYLSGLRYILANYNLDENNVFVSCKSLGGIQAMSFFYNTQFNFKGFGLLAPQMDTIALKLGYESVTKKVVASELGFSPDVNGVLNFSSSDPIPVGFWDYVTENMSKWVGYVPFFDGLPIKAEDKPTYYAPSYAGYAETGALCRTSLNRPLQIWVATDDDLYAECSAVVSSLNNGGMKAILRTMPSGTGGHHAVDNDPNALQTLNVTTKTGVVYASIPTAYYELGQYFDSLLTE